MEFHHQLGLDRSEAAIVDQDMAIRALLQQGLSLTVGTITGAQSLYLILAMSQMP